jgi:hypothetical protein
MMQGKGDKQTKFITINYSMASLPCLEKQAADMNPQVALASGQHLRHLSEIAVGSAEPHERTSITLLSQGL